MTAVATTAVARGESIFPVIFIYFIYLFTHFAGSESTVRTSGPERSWTAKAPTSGGWRRRRFQRRRP